MAEELIECRRYGGGDINKKIRQKGDARRRQQKELTDGFSVQEPINYKKSTSFSNNLEPLERFLRSNIGRPWSETSNCRLLDGQPTCHFELHKALLGTLSRFKLEKQGAFRPSQLFTWKDMDKVSSNGEASSSCVSEHLG
jgi:hypothetical protein